MDEQEEKIEEKNQQPIRERKEFNRQESDKKKRKNTFTVNCYECGRSTEINFKPDGVRPIYCQKCFQLMREKLIRGEEKKELNMEEVVPESGPEISLKEALGKKPTSFKQLQKDNGKNITDEIRPEESEELKEQKDSAKLNNGPKTLKPGEIVKF